MIFWILGGIAAGWFMAARLRVGNLVAVLLTSIALPLLVFTVMRRFDIDTVLGYAAFWAAVQVSYLLCNLGRARADDEAGTPHGLSHV